MTSNVKILNRLKRAANYTKLAFHKDGPHSYNRGQGALLKVLAKFGKEGTASKKELKKALGWHGREVSEVAKKAQKNGYVLVKGKKDRAVVTLTAKGRRIMEKRFDAEDRVAGEIFMYLSDKEKKELYKITGKIIEACEDIGVDYGLIERDKFHPDLHTRGGNGVGWGGPELHPAFTHNHPHEHDGVWHEHSHRHVGNPEDHHHDHFGGPAPINMAQPPRPDTSQGEPITPCTEDMP